MSKLTHAHGASRPDWDDTPHHESAPPAEGMVRVKCIIHTMPWTDTKALEFEEEADVPASIAEAMRAKKQVEFVKGG